jgi:glycosyltransferase involved in cell wall biosynthesis
MNPNFSKIYEKKIIFLTIEDPGYSRSWHYYSGVRKIGVDVKFVKIDSNRLFSEYLKLRKTFSRDDIFVVMSPSHYLTFYTRIFLGRHIVLDAGWSLFEATVLTRRKYGLFGRIFLKTYLIDFLSSHIAKKIILESKSQQDFYCKLFGLKRKKTYMLPTGVDEEIFSHTQATLDLPDYFDNSKIVLFRGKYNEESGIETLAVATQLLNSEDITFWIFCPGLPEDIGFSQFSYVNRGYIESKNYFSSVYGLAQITIGQLASNKRLGRTIPHKAFESAFMSKTYITARQPGIKELFLEGEEILCIRPSDSRDLADKIKELFENPEELRKFGYKMNKRYQESYSQKTLACSFMNIILDGM